MGLALLTVLLAWFLGRLLATLSARSSDRVSDQEPARLPDQSPDRPSSRLPVRVPARALGRPWPGGAPRWVRPRVAAVHLLLTAFAVLAIEPLLAPAVPYSYPLALAVCATLLTQFVARNACVPGVPLAGLGLLLNAAVVIGNGAMPVSLDAAERSGVPIERVALADDPRHEPLGTHTRLAPLADVIPTPIPGRREVNSVGDVLLAAGVGLYVFSVARGPALPPNASAAGRAVPPGMTAFASRGPHRPARTPAPTRAPSPAPTRAPSPVPTPAPHRTLRYVPGRARPLGPGRPPLSGRSRA